MNIITNKHTQEIRDTQEIRENFSLKIKFPRTISETKQCQRLIEEIYYEDFHGITFSNKICNPEARVELYPQYYLMGLVNDDLVAVVGLYSGKTNAERYGNVTPQEINQLLQESGSNPKYSGYYLREITKFAVRKEWRALGIGKVMLGVAHSHDFIQIDESRPHLLVACGSLSIFQYFSDAIGIRSRTIKPMPHYKIHQHYASVENPTETRLIIPEIDIPERWYNFSLPAEYYLKKLHQKEHI